MHRNAVRYVDIHENPAAIAVSVCESNKAILYVGANKANWFAERCGIDFESRRGYIAAYVYNTACPELSEYGEIEYKYRYRTMLRVA